MISCYSFGFTDPYDIFRFMEQYTEIQLFDRTTKYDKKCPKVLVFLSSKDLIFYIRTNQNNQVVCLLFDTPLKVFDWQGVNIVDAKLDSNELLPVKTAIDTNWHKSVLKDIKRNSQDAIVYTPRNIINLLIKYNIEGSFLNYYTAFLYSVQNVKQRDRFKELLLSYLFGESTVEVLITKVHSSLRKKVSNIRKSFEQMLSFLSTETGIRFLEALQSVRTNVDNTFHTYTLAAKKHKVDEYEIRYLHHVFSNLKNGKEA